jgi:Tetratricopeptide repeat
MGADHLDTTTRMGWLAELYRNQGRSPEAEPLYKRALAIDERVLDPKHSTVGTALDNLAERYRGILHVGISNVG